MTRDLDCVNPKIEHWFSSAYLWRALQRFDYENIFNTYNSAFSSVGLLPVVPGPSGSWRFNSIRGPCLDYFFETIYKDPADAGMLVGNLLLAEDRLLSYCAVLYTGKETFSKVVPDAVFYNEPEL